MLGYRLPVCGAVLGLAVCAPSQGTINATLLVAPAATGAAKDARAAGTAALVAAARDAVVHVFVEVSGKTTFKIERPSTGLVIDPRGLVLTWTGLVQEAQDAPDKRVVVQLGDKTKLPAKILATDARTGLALLQAEPGKPLTSIPLADSSRMPPGEPVLVLSRHDAEELVAFAGVAGRAVGATTIAGKEIAAKELIVTDAMIDSRGHGAALLDSRGRLLGICNAEHVHRDVQEPTLEDLKAPSFGVALGASAVLGAFGEKLAAKPAGSGDKAAPEAAAVARVQKSVVSVWAGEGDLPAIGLLDPLATRRVPKLGSGVIVSASGLVVTNRHLLGGAQRARVTLLDGRTFPAEVRRSYMMDNNLALLKLDLPKGQSVEAATCGEGSDARVGETVLGVGNPYGHTPTVSVGVLSAKRAGGLLQADPNLGNQNGGGALIDLAGRVLGIVDGGVRDKVDEAFAHRGEEAKTETNLSTCADLQKVRERFKDYLEAEAAETETIRTPAKASAAERDGAPKVAAAVAGAMLNIHVNFTTRAADEASNPFAQASEAKVFGESLGSGVIIDRTGLALSNWHVVDSATEPDGSMRKDHVVSARLGNGKTYPVKVLSISREDDLSLLQLVLPAGETVLAVELGDSDAVQVGEPVLAIGNPHGKANTVTAGIVSAKNQGIRVKGRWAKLENLIETDAAINGGNSGGALLDLSGRLLGINSAGSHGFASRGYAIPVNHVRQQVLSLLLSPEKLRSTSLGMQVGDSGGHVVVRSVDADGPARRAGIEVDDRILKLDDAALTWSVGWAGLLLHTPSTGKVSLVLERGGKPREVQIEPLSCAAWGVVRQTGLEVRAVPFDEDPKLVRDACTALHRRFTGDPKSEPTSLVPSVVRIERVLSRMAPEGADVAAGDLLLGVELQGATSAGEVGALRKFATPEEIHAFFNEREIGSYEGKQFRCWLYRKGEVRVVALQAKRLML